MKKIFPLFLVAMFLCWSLAVADITPSSGTGNILTTNTAPAEEFIDADVSYMRPVDSFISSDGFSYPPVILADTALLECPDTSIFSHNVHLPSDAWSAATSDNGSSQNYRVWENYTISGTICDIHWWGFMLEYDAGWYECYETAAFDIIFYPDNGSGRPDTSNPVCSYLGVVPVQDTTGFRYHTTLQLPLWRFDVENLTPCCTLQSGWIMIQGVSPSSPDCWFLWQSSATGDGSSWQWDGSALTQTGYDRSICLTGTVGQALGACCNDNNGQCVDSVLMSQCPTGVPGVRWAANTLCDDLYPPCGATLGACCDDQGNCTQTVEQDCPGLWLEETPCDPNPCPTAPPCTLTCPPNGILEGEPDCYEDYEDITNGGCNSDPPVFGSISVGDTICGTAGNYIGHDSLGSPQNRRDTDWYAITVTGDAMLYFYGVAEFPLQLLIIDAGSQDCIDYVVGPATQVAACSSAVVSMPVTPGVYWLWAGPANFVGTACGSNYLVWAELSTAPTGACCVGTDCVATNTMSECDALQGNWYMGETCPDFQCPILVDCQGAIWDNGNPTGGALASQCEYDYAFAAETADDFILPGTNPVTLEYVIAWAWFWQPSGSPNPISTPSDMEGVNVTIYAHDPDSLRPGGKPTDPPNSTCPHEEIIPGGIVYTAQLPQGSYGYLADDINVWRLMMPVNVTLDAGVTYWLGVQPIMQPYDPLGQSGWVPSDNQQGAIAMQIFELLDPRIWWPNGNNYDVAFCLKSVGGGGCDYVPGDVNGSDSYNGLDITYGVNFFKGGAAPVCPDCPPCNSWNYCGDVNGSCSYNGLDITYGVAYFKGGPGPNPCASCPPIGDPASEMNRQTEQLQIIKGKTVNQKEIDLK